MLKLASYLCNAGAAMDDGGGEMRRVAAAEAALRVITPVLLAGGSGTRLWPVSRQSHPKQFAPLVAGAITSTRDGRNN